MVDGSGVNEGGILHDIEETIAHLDFNAQLEPLVVDVETGTQFRGTIEAFGYQVVDEFIAFYVGFLVVLLRGEVKFRVDAAKDIGPNVVVTLGTVLDV